MSNSNKRQSNVTTQDTSDFHLYDIPQVPSGDNSSRHNYAELNILDSKKLYTIPAVSKEVNDETYVKTTPYLSKSSICSKRAAIASCFLFLILTTIVILVVLGVFTAFEITKLKLAMQEIQKENIDIISSSFHEIHTNFSVQNNNFQEMLVELSQAFNYSMEELQQNVYLALDHSAEQLEDNIHLLNRSVSEIKNDIEMFSRLQLNATSCAAILALSPYSPSGYYWIRSSNGSAVHVYCDMTRSCGGVTGGWMRVAELDMTNSSSQCPSGLQLLTHSGKCTCHSNDREGNCASVNFLTSMSYSKVCGRIKAYQISSTNAFDYQARGPSQDIDTYYVDGVSLTYGRGPRQHIWTFAAAADEIGSFPQYNCPCINVTQADRATSPPDFVGDDYFCDTGSQNMFQGGTFYGEDPLWDGAGCGPRNTCCSFNNPPWFYKQLSTPTTDDIEMRVCRDQDVRNEDVAIELYEIYVQ